MRSLEKSIAHLAAAREAFGGVREPRCRSSRRMREAGDGDSLCPVRHRPPRELAPVDLCSHAGRRAKRSPRCSSASAAPISSSARERDGQDLRSSAAAVSPGRAGYSADVGPRSGTLRRRCYSSVSSASGTRRICAYALSGDEKLMRQPRPGAAGAVCNELLGYGLPTVAHHASAEGVVEPDLMYRDPKRSPIAVRPR
jgi:hypothetical protein